MSTPSAALPPSAPDGLAAAVDMRDRAFRDDPHGRLRPLRESTRVARDVLGTWLVLHHADVSTMLRSSQLSREIWRSPGYDQLRPYIADSTLERTTHRWMVFNDPPQHTRLRRLVGSAFRPGVIEALRERITIVTDELLDEALAAAREGDGSFELMTALAKPLPVRIICDVMGLPREDYATTQAWSDTLAWIVEPVVRREQRVAAAHAAEAMAGYLREHIARRRAAPVQHDVLGLMIAAHDAESDGSGAATLTEDELLGNLILMFIAGHETTTNLIGNGLFTLLQHPQQMARLRDGMQSEPGLMHTAIEEMLRYNGSVTSIARHTVQPYAIGDVVVPPGQVLFGLLAAAHRDPAAFADPDRFDIARSPNPHIAFGAGIHYCLGAPLARLEAEIAFTRLLQRWPALRADDMTPHWRPLINLRGLEQLRLQPEPGHRVAT